MPAMVRLREEGKIRFIGVTEGFVADPPHQMLCDSLTEDLWDVVMVGFHMMHQNARSAVFPLTRANRVGTLAMFMFLVVSPRTRVNRLASGMFPTIPWATSPRGNALTDDAWTVRHSSMAFSSPILP